MSLPSLDQSFAAGSIQTKVGSVPQVSSCLAWSDRFGTYKARWGIGRMHYTVEPGLYALGSPSEQSPVFVTANYKMSFDRLREALPGRNAWILVLDTQGINVWCASGKGTFGTKELVGRIKSSGLEQIISHRELILPQLSGPGVAAHLVKKLSGFKVTYGPILASDLPAFLDDGLKATPEMRRKTFTTRERMALIPMEVVGALKVAMMVIPVLFFLALLGRSGAGLTNALHHSLFSILDLLIAILAGAVFTPLLLPWLPGRAFSVKGFLLGILAVATLIVFGWNNWVTWSGRLEILAWVFGMPAISAYLAMNFTGASTYTSLSGVREEMRWALPLQIGSGIVGTILWLGSNFIA